MKTGYLFIAILFVFCQCKSDAPRYGETFNPERKKAGLRILDNTYTPVFGDGYSRKRKAYLPIISTVKNLNLSEGINTPACYEKVSFLNPKTGSLLFEEDHYVSGKNKPGIDFSIYEVVVYRYVFQGNDDTIALFSDTYNYQGKIDVKSGWQYLYIHPEAMKVTSPSNDKIIYYEQKIDDISKQKADSILEAWKIKRLNY